MIIILNSFLPLFFLFSLPFFSLMWPNRLNFFSLLRFFFKLMSGFAELRKVNYDEKNFTNITNIDNNHDNDESITKLWGTDCSLFLLFLLICAFATLLNIHYICEELMFLILFHFFFAERFVRFIVFFFLEFSSGNCSPIKLFWTTTLFFFFFLTYVLYLMYYISTLTELGTNMFISWLVLFLCEFFPSVHWLHLDDTLCTYVIRTYMYMYIYVGKDASKSLLSNLWEDAYFLVSYSDLRLLIF